jgi:hypothetical protein
MWLENIFHINNVQDLSYIKFLKCLANYHAFKAEDTLAGHWWSIPVISALTRPKQENFEFKVA